MRLRRDFKFTCSFRELVLAAGEWYRWGDAGVGHREGQLPGASQAPTRWEPGSMN